MLSAESRNVPSSIGTSRELRPGGARKVGGERTAPIPLPVLCVLGNGNRSQQGRARPRIPQSALPAPLCTSVWDMLYHHHHHHHMTMDVDLFYRILDGAALAAAEPTRSSRLRNTYREYGTRHQCNMAQI
jgi:hypothetical protein